MAHSARLASALTAAVIAGLIAPGPAAAQEPAAPVEQGFAGNYDYNGDGRADLVARRDETGILEVWPGSGSGGFGQRYDVGPGWNGMDLLATAGDLDEDGRADLLARRASDGALLFYGGDGTGFRPPVRIGFGWDAMSAVVAGHDYDGDGRADYLAVESATGYLWLYPGDGTGGHGVRVRIGSSWNAQKELTAIGDMDEDGHPDIVAVRGADECMYFYGGPGSQGFRRPVMFDCGWDVMASAAAAGDFNGDGHADWVGRETANGLLYLFTGDGEGGHSSSPVIDVGWGKMTIA
ncbi:FG-GAP repeat domain-containing protein [Glycomyces sp. NPDC048151]|uniref:FG-GAP repeat domain-containing protein n=1 Tax=Glycomyces sp. NPDC048151 TaxID=3364002 RepID=UPI003712A537